MKVVVAALALLVGIWAETLQADIAVRSEDEVRSEGIPEHEKSDHCNICVELRDMVVEQRVQLQELKEENMALKARLASTEYTVEALKEENASQPKVEFSVALGYRGYYGPFSTDVTLTFSKVFTNTGNAYNPITGVFTAPVKGIFHFTLNIFGLSDRNWMGAALFKNNQRIFGMYEFPNGLNKSSTRSVSLVLDQGDVIYIKLTINHQIYDDHNTYNIFSGFLLFPL